MAQCVWYSDEDSNLSIPAQLGVVPLDHHYDVCHVPGRTCGVRQKATPVDQAGAIHLYSQRDSNPYLLAENQLT
jgi:hypothetical protein